MAGYKDLNDYEKAMFEEFKTKRGYKQIYQTESYYGSLTAVNFIHPNKSFRIHIERVGTRDFSIEYPKEHGIEYGQRRGRVRVEWLALADLFTSEEIELWGKENGGVPIIHDDQLVKRVENAIANEQTEARKRQQRSSAFTRLNEARRPMWKALTAINEQAYEKVEGSAGDIGFIDLCRFCEFERGEHTDCPMELLDEALKIAGEQYPDEWDAEPRRYF